MSSHSVRTFVLPCEAGALAIGAPPIPRDRCARRHRRGAAGVPALCLLLLISSLAAAQEPARYEAAPGPRSYRSMNPYFMYWVKGDDTVGTPVRPMHVERQWWTRNGDRLQVIVRQAGGAADRRLSVDTFDVAPNGRVRAINGDTAKFRGRYDLVPRLPSPARVLEPGVEWRDSIGFLRPGIVDEYAYVVTRNYRVHRLLDSLGRRLVEIEIEGRMRYRDEYWVDSTAGTHVWLDVSGPIHETALLDPHDGLLIRTRWDMHLRGTGAIPDSTGMDTVPAGLRSGNEMSLISEASADLLLRELPAGDTTITISGGSLLFLHTVRRSADSVSSSLARADGMVGTVDATFAHARPTSYRALWTDSSAIPRRTEITTRADSLVIRDSTEHVTAIPDSSWAIADYAMGEHLVPLLLSLPADGQTRSVAIYRPVAGHWDRRQATVRRLPDALLAILQGEPDGAEAYLIVGDGELLFAENGGPRGAQRVPRPGTPQRATLEAIMRRFGGR